jgi:hypothetical protein
MPKNTDPREDRHPETGTPGKYPTPPGDAKPAPGGAVTGTEPKESKTDGGTPKP